MKNIFEWILSKLFPPKFDPIRDFSPDTYSETFDGTNHWIVGKWCPGEGSCGKAQPKRYRDGIHRVSTEGL